MDRASRVAFFYEWAGWSYDPLKESPKQGRQRCAESLASAEEWAEEAEVSFEWTHDELPWDGDCDPPNELLCCLATHGDETASLCGIGDPSDQYRRVVQAELALELQTDMFTVLRQHMDNLR